MADPKDPEGPTNAHEAEQRKKLVSFGEKIKNARVERGVTQAQLADRLRVKQAMVSMIETGEVEYSDELRGRLKSWVDSGEGPPSPSKRGPYHKTRTTIG